MLVISLRKAALPSFSFGTDLTLQAAGHVLLIGQKSICRIYILTINHVHDQTLRYRSTTKSISEISGQGSVEVVRADGKAWKYLVDEKAS